ncbi:MFS general substrate transporter, partial [Auriculariales sp. MPI-PUGE-AT-0066]
DGGLEAWLVILGSWLIMFASNGYIQSFGVYQAYYDQILGKSSSAISWIGSFQLWLLYGGATIVGRVFDDGWGKVLILGGSLLYVICVFTISLCKEYWQVFLAQGLGLGLSLATLTLPALAVIPHWFSARRALATGVAVSGSCVGELSSRVFMLNNLIASHGFAYAVRATGYLILGCLAVACFLIKFRIPARKHRASHMQLPPPDIGAIMRHKTYWVATAGVFLITWGIFFPIFYLQASRCHPQLAFYLISILSGASVIGSIVPNFLADKFGPYNSLMATSLCAAILVFVFPLVGSTGGSIAFAVLYGFFSATYSSLIPAISTSLSVHLGEIGVRMGIAWTVYSLAALSGPPICGALLGNGPFNWWRPVAFSGTSLVAGSALLFVARTMLAKTKGSAMV